ERGVLVARVLEMRVVLVDDKVRQRLYQFGLPAMGEDFERAEADVARGHADDDRARLDRFAIDLQIGADDAERPRGWDAEGVERLAAQVFADARTQHRAAVAEAGKHRLAGALEVQVPALARRVLHFAEQDRPAVAELGDPRAELMPRVFHRDRFAP